MSQGGRVGVDVERIRRALATGATGGLSSRWAERQSVGPARVRSAAVLVPVLVGAGDGPRADGSGDEIELLFIVRPGGSSTHAGQVAFPGGVADEGDEGPVATALREAEEELGIPRGRPEIIGRLSTFPTHTGFVVTPVVGLIHGTIALTPSPSEVASVFTAPLSALMAPENRRTMRSRWGPGLPDYRLQFWPFLPATLWGATGHMVAELVLRLSQR